VLFFIVIVTIIVIIIALYLKVNRKATSQLNWLLIKQQIKKEKENKDRKE